MARKVTTRRSRGATSNPRARTPARAASAGRRRSITAAASSRAPAGPTAGLHGATSSPASSASPRSTALSATATASNPGAPGSTTPRRAAGTATVPISGQATRLLSGERGASCWKRSAATGRVPAVAPRVAESELASQRSQEGLSGGTRRVSRGPTRIIPATAEKLSWKPISPTTPGSDSVTRAAASPSRVQGRGSRPTSTVAAAATTMTAARRAEAGAPTEVA